ncbi:MAG TPA: putative toxin-antitoxin system toxin component, PIN family [Nitrospirae bacterium]|nr:putative toxin-antitoxin system toxin component, PIN family [Nitrospirota bacterium]
MKIIFDTNVLISAFIATGPAKDVFEYIIENHDVILSPYILKELREKLVGKLGFALEEYKEIKEMLTGSVIISVEKSGKIRSFSDKKDLPILNLCISVQADLLITGDKQIRKLKRIGNTKIVSPSEFWNIEKGVL